MNIQTTLSVEEEQGVPFTPTTETEYTICLCRSRKTLTLAKVLFHKHGIHAWVPRKVNNRPKPGEKRVKAALPGFLFVPVEEFKEADRLQKRLLVPTFKALVVNGLIKQCTHKELVDFETAIKASAQTQLPVTRELHVGDNVVVSMGPFTGIKATIEEIYYSGCLMVTIKSGNAPVIRMPAAFLS